MPKSSNDGITASSDTTTSIEHSRTNPQLQHTIASELNQYQGDTKEQLLSIKKEGYVLKINCRQQTTLADCKESDSSHPSRVMQWTLLAIVTVITLITLIAPLALAILKNQALLAIPSVGALPLGYIWVRLALFGFPVNERDH